MVLRSPAEGNRTEINEMRDKKVVTGHPQNAQTRAKKI
jgi:hypothetical protein